MSRRPRTHQIEDISARHFEGLLPDAWISRLVVPDYGVDREVETFTVDGDATGLKFAVQLRATDDPARGDRVVLKTELLDYLLEYDVPAIVARYDVSTNVIRWTWASVIGARARLKPNQKTFTHRFASDDNWDEETPAKIERVLRARRALTNFPASAAMPVRLVVDESVSFSSYVINRAVRGIVADSLDSLVAAADETAPVELKIRVREGFLSVDFDMLGGITFDIDTSDIAKLTSAILYAMAYLFPRKKLGRHGREAGRIILAGRHIAGDAELAARASYAFPDDGMAQAELAILNGLHLGDTPYYPVVVASLIKTGIREDSTQAVQHFLAAALDAVDGEPSRAAAVHYSTANALRASQPARALFHYNRARHLRPNYLDADYFLSEVGGTLFGARRFACAAQAYLKAEGIAPTHKLQLKLGDALLHLGEVEAASRRFQLASSSETAPLVEEAVVKLELCHMLMEAHGIRVPADWSRPMGDVPEGMDGRAAWIGHLATVNALDPLAHFNLGVTDAKLGDDGSALGHFVACAVVQSGDVEAWTNAIVSAFRTGQAELALTLIHLSVRLAGLAAYDALRDNLLSQGGDSTLVAELDAVALAIDQRQDSTVSKGVTLRVLDGDRVEIIGSTDN